MNNRRKFLFKSALAVFGFSVLPAALTYSRKWKKTKQVWVPNPAWVDAPYEMSYIVSPYYSPQFEGRPVFDSFGYKPGTTAISKLGIRFKISEAGLFEMI